ncbi:hypothetical protein SBC1_27320 [Caballeronia sp. SBC1]|nr:hypothetical protein SBC1_27320 [Caballeronia sp. SBC1]
MKRFVEGEVDSVNYDGRPLPTSCRPTDCAA